MSDTENTGNLKYSLDRNELHKILTDSHYVKYYIMLAIFSLLFIYKIRYKQVIFPDREKMYEREEDSIFFFKNITQNSPFRILEISEQINENSKGTYMGLTTPSYLFIIISYTITLLLILEGIIRNILYTMYSKVIELNPNNNPYNNPNCVTKIKDSPDKTININYTAIFILSLNFLLPFVIPYLISFLDFDNYDIKHNMWIKYVILYLIFYPFLIMIISKATFYKKLEILPDLKKYVETTDYGFINSIISTFNFKVFCVIPYLFIIFVFCYYIFVHLEFKYDKNKKKIIYWILFVILFIFIPLFIYYFSLSVLFDNNAKNILDINTFEAIKNYGVNNFYDLIIKYNYPCFFK
jgi:hypothetical protein